MKTSIALILSTKLIFLENCFWLFSQHLRQFSCFFHKKNEVLRKVSSAPRELKLVVGLLERFNREPLVFKTWCAFPTKHQKYHRICWKKTFHNSEFHCYIRRNLLFSARQLRIKFIWLVPLKGSFKVHLT